MLLLPISGIAATAHSVLMLDDGKRNQQADHTQLVFSAMGKDFHISLSPSGILTSTASQQAGLPTLLQGTVDGYDQSWARISIHNGDPTGYIWLENQLYQLALSTDLPSNTILKTKPTSKWVIYQPNALPARWQSRNTTIKKAVTRAIRIGVAVDTQFDLWHRGRGLAKALEVINGVDGLFQQQLGVAVVIESILELNKLDTDPLLEIDGKLEAVLLGFRKYRATQPQLNDALTLVHLFSGHRDAESIVGLGWIDTACRSDGYNLSVSTPFAFDVLLAAHEIAHNLGALHDDDPRCAGSVANATSLMISTLNSDTTSALSNCSVNNMRPAINRSCNVDNIDLALRVRSNPTSTNGLERVITLTVDNTDVQRAAKQVKTRTTFPNGTSLRDVPTSCSLDEGELVCTHNDIKALGQDSLSMVASLPDEQGRRITSIIELDRLSDINIINNRSSIDALAIVSGEELAQADGSQSGASAGSGLGRSDYFLLLILLVILQRRYAINFRTS